MRKTLIAVLMLVLVAAPAMAADVEVGGVLELQLVNSDDNDVKNQDIVQATVELGFNAKVNDKVDAEIVLLLEDDGVDDPLGVDTATITYQINPTVYFKGGMTAIPFGNFNTYLISDPVTLVLGETADTIAAVGYSTGGIEVEFGAFNGDVTDDAAADEKVDKYYLAVNYEDEGSGIQAGVSYITDISESDGMQDALAVPGPGPIVVDSAVAALALYVIYDAGQIHASGEYITAMGEYEATDPVGDTAPKALNISAAYDVDAKTQVAVGYGSTSDVPGAPESVIGFAAHYAIEDDTTVSGEFLSGDYEGGGSLTAITVQIAVEF